MRQKISLFTIALLSACSNLPPAPGVGNTPTDSMQSFRIQFSPEVNGQAFQCGKSYPGLGTTQSTIEPRDFRMYLSNIKLVKANGEAIPLQLSQDDTWQKHSTVLLDFEDKTGACETGTPETNFEIKGLAPAGNYQGLRFELGLPFEMNHQDLTQASSPLNITSMFWSWRGGYKFLRADMRTSGMPQGYYLHLGSTGCTGVTPGIIPPASPEAETPHNLFQLAHDGVDHDVEPTSEAQTNIAALSESQTVAPEVCSHPNLSSIALSSFDPQNQKIVVDLGHLLSQSNLDQNQADTAAGCMSQPEDNDCKAIFENLGLPFAEASAKDQTFFAVKSK